MTEITKEKTELNSPTCEIVTIGSELLLGQITDTNTTYLARELGKIGVTILFRTAVADQLKDIESVILHAAERCDMLITTGGLGPTLDDITREAVAGAAGSDLEFREDLMEQITGIFRSSGFKMPDNNRRQAYVPSGSRVIANPVGTAPAFIAEVRGKPVICLPGVPRELKYLLANEVVPWVMKRFGLDDHNITYRVLKTAGIGEGSVDKIIGDLMGEGSNPEVGLLASAGEIKIRITAKAEDAGEAEDLIKPVELEIRARLGDRIFGQDEDTLEQVVNELLADNDLTLAVLETFSAGVLTQKLYGVDSPRLIESRVIHDREGLQRLLRSNKTELESNTARDLALRIREDTGADIGMAVIGFPEKHDGRYILDADLSIAGGNLDKENPFQTGGDLSILRQRGSMIALNVLRLALLN